MASSCCAGFWKPAPLKHADASKLRKLDVPQDTLFAILLPHLVDFEVIRERGYAAQMEAAQMLLGVVPTADAVFEIWPPAYRCYNIMLPNLLNLPAYLLGVGTQPTSLISLALYVSSKAADCPYCTGHTCTFALRRGASPAALKEALSGTKLDVSALSRAERAVVAVARSLGQVPCQLTREEADELRASMSAADAEWVVAAVAMMGGLNKWMDALGTPLEPDVYAETAHTLGADWSAGKASQMLTQPGAAPRELPEVDNWRFKLRLLWLGLRPGGLLVSDARLVRGIPSSSSEAAAFLQARLGHSFPILSKLKHSRVRQALTAALALNFDEGNSAGVSCRNKILASAVAANIMHNAYLLNEVRSMAGHFGVSDKEVQDALTPTLWPSDRTCQVMLKLATAVAYSPARVTAPLVAECKSCLSAAMLVELVSAIACMQMLHRLECFYIVVED